CDQDRTCRPYLAQAPAPIVPLGRYSTGLHGERIVVLAPAHRRAAEAGPEVDALHGGDREEEMSERRLDGLEERLAHAGRETRHDCFDDAADAIAVFPGRLDFLDHAVRRLEVGTPHGAEFDVRRNLLRRDGLRGDPPDL